MKILKTT